MRNPWETGEAFDYNGRTIRPAWCDATSRIENARSMTVERLRECLAWPDTQKTVRQFIARRLRKMSADAALTGGEAVPSNGVVGGEVKP